jgi:Tfp pilus assembly protein PilX
MKEKYYLASKSVTGNERGMVLIVSLLIISVLLLLGTTAVLTSTTDMKISSNYKTSSQAFHIAEAGAEAARETLRQAVAGGATLSTLLAAARGADGALTNSYEFTQSGIFTNFYVSGAFISDDVPYAPTTSFGSGTYRVYLTNDPVEGVTNATDSNNTVTLTSFGFGPQGSMAVVQITVGKAFPSDAPGAIVLPGPDATCDPGESGAKEIKGMTKPAVAVNSENARKSVVGMIKKPELITGSDGGEPSVQKITLGSPWDSVADLQSLRDQLSATADFRSTSATGFTLGTTADPKVVFITGDADFSASDSGAGILVVTGKLTLRGAFSYSGLIMAVGNGEIERSGGGGGTILGSIILANLTGSPAIFGTANFHTSGGGNSTIQYDAGALSNSLGRMPFVKKSWKQSGLD